MTWRAWVPDERPRLWPSVTLGLALAGGATVLRLPLTSLLGASLPFICYFPVIIAAAVWGGFAGGVACLIGATFAAVALILPGSPQLGWQVTSFWISGGLIAVVGAAMADTVRELKSNRSRLSSAQDELHTLVHELAHRNRNALTVIMSIVSQSARVASTPAEVQRIVNARLGAMARAQDVLMQSRGQAAPLQALLARTLEPFELERFTFAASPDVEIPREVATALGLLMHELATNALKYGALSAPTGRVRIQWLAEPLAVRLIWQETGGPEVSASPSKGFGTRLLAAALKPYGGRAERRFEVGGLTCELMIPTPGPVRSEAPSRGRRAPWKVAEAHGSTSAPS